MIELPLLVELSAWETLVANIGAWAAFHAGTGYAAHRLRDDALDRDTPFLRVRPAEVGLYRQLGIRRWKGSLPEAGDLFPGGISKRHVGDSVVSFIRETRRAELAHWWALALGPACALWNPPVGFVLMVAYGVVVNAPFIAIQRYNRARAERLLTRLASR